MATRRRRKPRRKRTKLVLLLLPIGLLVALLVWLFLDEVRQLLDSSPVPTKRGTPAPSTQPGPESTERILDPERKKLDEILESR